jgi:hypothetical protein
MIEVEIDFQVSGHKSSEGDGRTAADIEAELEARRVLLEKESGEIPGEETD